jgi:hypothetical protein
MGTIGRLFPLTDNTNGTAVDQNLQITNSNSEFEIVKEFNYLGILLTKPENFKRQL